MARPALTLHTSRAQLERLFAEEDRPRASARSVTVDRQALKNVLMDHANLLNALRDHGRVVEGIEQ